MLYDSDTPARTDQTAQLEQAFMNEYLERLGYTTDTLSALPAPDAEAIRKAASLYSSARLAEMESRAHYVHEIHDIARRD